MSGVPEHSRTRRKSLLFLALLCVGGSFVGTGCTHVVTSQERLASFAPHAAVKVDGQPVRSYLLERTGFLIGGADVIVERDGDGQAAGIELRNSDPTRLAFGSATAIDSRGYLLTAAHCVENAPVYVLLHSNNVLARVEKAEVLWRGDP